eukprot:10260809-Karenia_brevis.AAC.1
MVGGTVRKMGNGIMMPNMIGRVGLKRVQRLSCRMRLLMKTDILLTMKAICFGSTRMENSNM